MSAWDLEQALASMDAVGQGAMPAGPIPRLAAIAVGPCLFGFMVRQCTRALVDGPFSVPAAFRGVPLLMRRSEGFELLYDPTIDSLRCLTDIPVLPTGVGG